MTSPEPVTLSLNAMATRFEIVLYGAEPPRLRAAGEEALEEIAALDKQLSLYRPESEITRINAFAARGPVKVEPRLFRLLQLASTISVATEGAFDVTIAPLMRVWGLAGGEGHVPSESDLEAARERVGMGLIILNESDFTVSFEREGVEIDLGAIGKGCAIDRAVETLRESGVESALIHGGTSTIYGVGTLPDGSAWRVGVRDPSQEASQIRTVDLHDSSLSVSAPHGKSFVHEGRRYGHVIDPRTGWPSSGVALAAVWGPSATETDALSTALLVLGESGLDILDEHFPDYSGDVVLP
jgi:thiamine biosynthesis lipoprotein